MRGRIEGRRDGRGCEGGEGVQRGEGGRDRDMKREEAFWPEEGVCAAQ